MFRLTLCLSLILLAGTADARMYQWVDPVTGSLQMSGKPPAWYRSGWDGPRVRVFDNGTVVDDTSIQVSEDEMQALREDAFRQFDEARQLNALKRLESEALKETEREQRLSRVDDLSVEDLDEDLADDEILPDSIDEDTIDELKDLIKEWDSLNLPLGSGE